MIRGTASRGRVCIQPSPVTLWNQALRVGGRTMTEPCVRTRRQPLHRHLSRLKSSVQSGHPAAASSRIWHDSR